MAKPKVCHISTVHDLYDTRVYYKECIDLAKHYDLSLVIQAKESIKENGINIVALPRPKNRIIRTTFSIWRAFKLALATKSELMHIHDPELLLIAPFLKLKGKKVIFDRHENVEGQIIEKAWLGPKWLRSIISGMYIISEKILVMFCDKVIIVIREMENKIPQKKAVLVRNFPRAAAFQTQINSNKFERLSFIYVGGLTRIRGIREMIEAFSLSNIEADLYLLGKWESAHFEDECMKFSDLRVKFLGMQPLSKTYECMAKCHVGLCLFHLVPNHLESLPQKLFEYLFSDLELVLSKIPYWEKLLGEKAQFVDPTDLNELTNLFNSFNQSKVLEHSNKRNKKWAMEQFSWESEFHKLHETYKELLEA